MILHDCENDPFKLLQHPKACVPFIHSEKKIKEKNSFTPISSVSQKSLD